MTKLLILAMLFAGPPAVSVTEAVKMCGESDRVLYRLIDDPYSNRYAVYCLPELMAARCDARPERSTVCTPRVADYFPKPSTAPAVLGESDHATLRGLAAPLSSNVGSMEYPESSAIINPVQTTIAIINGLPVTITTINFNRR